MSRSAVPSLVLAFTLAACAQPAPTPAAPAARPTPAPSAQPPGGPGGPPPAGATTANTRYRAAIYVAGGQYRPAQSAHWAVKSGVITNQSTTNATIIARQPDFNGLLARGANTNYLLSHSAITLSGNGSNDFVGLGAGAMAADGANLTLRDVTITTTGLTRSAVVATGHSTLRVYNSTLRVNGGTLPPGYRFRGGPGMISPPPGLHIGGTARAALTMDNSRSYFYHDTIISGGWAGLSTDGANGYVYLEADDSDIRLTGPGYGIYADAGCVDVINNSRITTKTYNAIMAGVSHLTFNNVHGVSDANAVMIHNVMGRPRESATLAINGGIFNTAEAALLIRSANAGILIDGAVFHPANGTLIRSEISDDANRTQVNGQPSPGINIELKHMNLAGNILADDSERAMRLDFVGTSLRGAIQNAHVRLDAASHWLATASSTVTLLGDQDLPQLDAPAGVTITAMNGVGSHLTGEYHLKSGGTLRVLLRQ
jgi:hypothetical protein